MASHDVAHAAAELLIEFGDVESAERAAGARLQTACNASERAFWDAVRSVLEAGRTDRPDADDQR